MSRKYKRLDDWKAELIGNTYTFLTVVDVIQSVDSKGKKLYLAVCKCKCGKECSISVYAITSGHNKSCGCYETSEENSLRHREINLKNRDKMSIARKEWCKNNPEKVKEIGKKKSKWCKENTDRVKEAGIKYSEWCKNNPSKIKERSDKYRQWCKENPEKVKSMIASQQEWRKDLDKLNSAIEKRANTIKNNPDTMKLAGEKISNWCKCNRDAVLKSTDIAQAAHKEKSILRRSNIDFSEILEYVHPDYIEKVIAGLLGSDDVILIKCPNCGNYAEHRFGNVFIFGKHKPRANNSVLCNKCHRSMTRSHYEDEIADFISSFYSTKPDVNSRSIIYPFEIDLYYPDKKIAIEFNGTYWHSTKIKDSDYHYKKFIRCAKSNIILVNIFEFDWVNRKDQIKKYLIDLFNNKENEISFNKDGYINNNFPPPWKYNVNNDLLTESIITNNNTVFTCGYTKA